MQDAQKTIVTADGTQKELPAVLFVTGARELMELEIVCLTGDGTQAISAQRSYGGVHDIKTVFADRDKAISSLRRNLTASARSLLEMADRLE